MSAEADTAPGSGSGVDPSELDFDEFVPLVEQAAREYVSATDCEWRNTNHFKAKWLDIDASGRRIGLALTRLQSEGTVESVSNGANGASAWRITDDGAHESTD